MSVLALLLPLCFMPLPGPGGTAVAQVPAEPVLEGEVRLAEEVMQGAMVVLHQVTPARSGEIDSLRTDTQGRFRFTLPSVPSADARSEVFFASVRHDGILYFGSLLGEAVQLDTLYQILVHDTASAPEEGATFPIGVRNIILEPGVDGSWQVTDLIQIRNDADRTWVSREGAPIWSYPLAEGGVGFTVGQSDLAEDAVSFEGGQLRVSAPVPPGERLYVIRYVLAEPETVFPMPGTTERIQLLIREPAPPIAVEGLRADQPAELEPGSTYRMYSGENLEGGQIRLTLTPQSRGLPMEWIAVVLALILGGMGIFAASRRRGPVPATAGPTPLRPSPLPYEGDDPDSRAELLAAIARLDDQFESGPRDAASRTVWEERRRELKDRLRALG